MRFSMKEKLPFTSAFLQEASRFRTSTNWIFRKSNEQISVRGYTIPKETTVRFYAILRNLLDNTTAGLPFNLLLSVTGS